ncbi:unnamed protein product [Haemonchus placei]|uniref:Dihydrodipicolinate reductase n=1 Tax=Haemonchus placei TaxID=6290 RepID=A0A0N4WL31_HAEPC|nr:unnamed protein product [Haemonchus placei]
MEGEIVADGDVEVGKADYATERVFRRKTPTAAVDLVCMPVCACARPVGPEFVNGALMLPLPDFNTRTFTFR